MHVSASCRICAGRRRRGTGVKCEGAVVDYLDHPNGKSTKPTGAVGGADVWGTRTIGKQKAAPGNATKKQAQ